MTKTRYILMMGGGLFHGGKAVTQLAKYAEAYLPSKMHRRNWKGSRKEWVKEVFETLMKMGHLSKKDDGLAMVRLPRHARDANTYVQGLMANGTGKKLKRKKKRGKVTPFTLKDHIDEARRAVERDVENLRAYIPRPAPQEEPRWGPPVQGPVQVPTVAGNAVGPVYIQPGVYTFRWDGNINVGGPQAPVEAPVPEAINDVEWGEVAGQMAGPDEVD